ncbi:MAG: TIGR02597 family protein [Opitutales bacterium]
MGRVAVGYFPLEVPGGASSAIGLPLERHPVYAGEVRAAEGSHVLLTDVPRWRRNALAGRDGGERFFVQFTTGALAGEVYLVEGNARDRLSLAAGDLTGLRTREGAGEGDRLRVVPYWTPASIFAHVTVPSGSTLQVPSLGSGVLRSEALETLTCEVGSGWTDGAGAPADHWPIPPGRGVWFRPNTSSALFTVDLKGVLPPVAVRVEVASPGRGQPSSELLSLPYPVAMSLAELALAPPAAAVLEVLVPGAGPGDPPTRSMRFDLARGWLGADMEPVEDTFRLEPGAAFRLRLPSGRGEGQVFGWAPLPGYLSAD